MRKFFPSIDHAVLKELFRRRIKDCRLLALMDGIVDRANPQEEVTEWFPGDDLFSPAERRRGLPIGNLTSQWFANWYLDGLDHLLTSRLRIGGYVRYCDDFVLLDNDRGRLQVVLAEARHWLAGVRLRLHEERLAIVPSRAGRLFVGYRTWPTHRLLPAANIRAFVRRMRWMRRCYRHGDISSAEVQRRIASWLGHAQQANTQHLVKRLAREWVFRRRARKDTKQHMQTRLYVPKNPYRALRSREKRRKKNNSVKVYSVT